MNKFRIRKGSKDLFISILCLLVSFFCFFETSFSVAQIEIKLADIFLGVILFLFTYLLVFKEYKTINTKSRYVFFFETLLFISIILMSFIFPGMGLIKKEQLPSVFAWFLEWNHCLFYLVVVHTFIKLHVEYFKKEKNLSFSLYLIAFGFGNYIMNSPINPRNFILKTISVLSLLQCLYFLFTSIKKMKNNNQK
ncbi:hypothetical protein [Candidatus Phytoplasma australiense]|uniref:Uncharacterized protein n=1 Tax=Strawberry lethal yellows phytoplasma (CPA) str. NZSb11 TaxID=980422 RepID=R4RQC4_PHYAS|nr:hypothetical protein [Candidatus Phytoplasma australiense]AGL90706.1 hypothetical protein SLY_0791 [Strawberry lethal yellows phytoplasma (CPA) str. NZSb11]